jgi:1,4-alpha-glucan branching enzyme
LDWSLLDLPLHKGVQRWIRDLNYYLRDQAALYEVDFDSSGFEWIDSRDSGQNIISFVRYSSQKRACVLVICNFAPVLHEEYVIGCPVGGEWLEVLNSDAECYGGSGEGNQGRVFAENNPQHSRPYSLRLRVPPLSVSFFESQQVDGTF